MVSSQDSSEMAAQFLDLGIPDVGIEDLFKDLQLLGSDELLVIKKATVPDHRTGYHVLDLVDDPGSNFGRFHRKFTSICFQWKFAYLNLPIAGESSFPVEPSRKAWVVAIPKILS